MRRETFREIAIALSLSNLLFITSWRNLLYPEVAEYHVKFGPSNIDHLSAILCVILLAALLFGAVRLFRYFYQEKASLLINLAFIFGIMAAATSLRFQFKESDVPSWVIPVSHSIFLIALIVSLTRWRRSVFGPAKAIVLLFAPFVLVTFSQAFLAGITAPVRAEHSGSRNQRLNDRAADNSANRVVWVIFDEFDYRIPFELNAIEMPEFQKLKDQSLSATNARSPARFTLESIPSLLTGREVTKATTRGKSELDLNFADGSSGQFSKVPNIFDEVAQLNRTSAVVGYYHPYCRLFNRLLSACKCEKYETETYVPGESIGISVRRHVVDAVWPIFVTIAPGFVDPMENGLRRTEVITERHPQMLAEIGRIIQDPTIDFTFIHLPYPHPPARFNRHTQKFENAKHDYVNNLALTDMVLGEIRRSMENAGQWDTSTVIVSSDHPLRTEHWKTEPCCLTPNDFRTAKNIEDTRIPFFLKLPEQKDPIVYDRPFNTVVTRELITSILKGEISTPEQVKSWLDTK